MNVGSRRALGSRYELVDAIGSGAMGEVWRAWDSTDQVYRAAKVLRSEYTSDPEILTRFIQERSILLGLQHENIVRVHDLVVEGEQLAIVMELVEGPSLRGYLRESGTLRPAEAVEVTCAVLDALVVAHRARALHRDVKPDNVLLTGSTPITKADVKLTDFGIARLAQESTVQATGLLGTPAYMPPELFEHGTFSAASDVYAVGVTLYELLAGRTPFAGAGNAHTVGFRHVSCLPPELPVPKVLWDVLSSMLAKDPTLRLTPADNAIRLRELLPSLSEVAALPVRAEPVSWEKVAQAGVAGPVHVTEIPADEDVGATRLRGALPAAVEPLARAGELQGFVDNTVEDGVTQLRVARPERAQAPVLQSKVQQANRSRRSVLWGGLAVTGLAGLIVILVMSGVFSSRGSSTPQTSTADSVQLTAMAEQWKIGINQTNKAIYNARTQSVDLTVTYTSSYPLSGSMLIVLRQPGSQGETTDCAGPDVTWDGNAGVALAGTAVQSIPGVVPITCGFAVRVTGGLSNSGASFTAHIPVTAAPSRQALQTWLDSINTHTLDAISGLGNIDANDFTLQRLVGISVQGDRTVTAGMYASVRYWVYPKWQHKSGATTDKAHPLWKSPSDGGDPAITAIGIDPSSAVKISGMALQQSDSTGTVFAPHGGTGTITVTVAGLDSSQMRVTATEPLS